MSLAEYKRKRDFKRTPEPAPSSRAAKLRFVVQEHAASRLHYDFRLELDGKLKSWAVPKGPSLDPNDKRLAMMVEDHPLDYRTFEGVIPAGNYGAGQVIVWDEGFYEAPDAKNSKESIERLRAGLAKGDLKFVLHGTKLNGEFVLAKIKSSRDGKENAWLLIKKKDGFAAPEDITARDRSVRSGKTLRDLGAPEAKIGRERKSASLEGAPRADLPHDIRPMLAVAVEESFDRKDWIFEIKWDGFRAIAEIVRGRRGSHGKVRLYSRNQLSLNERFKPIVRALELIKHDVVFDGEVVVLDPSGHANFEWLQNYHRESHGELVYMIFDILHLDGHDLRILPLARRKEVLSAIVPNSPRLRVSGHVAESGRSFFKEAIRLGVEGIMAKDGTSPYRPGKRSEEWMKIKAHARQEAVIGGFTAPRGSRKEIGALVLGVYEKGKLTYIGHTGGGLESAGLESLRKKLEPLIIEGSPFETKPKTNAPATWVRPELVCEVKFQEWTGDGRMRMPIFLGLRPDKSAREVRREDPESVEEGMKKEEALKNKRSKIEAGAFPEEQRALVHGRELHFTHLEKIFWPKEGYTKGDLIDYYRKISGTILPYLHGRPESLHRHPNGIEGESFFQKNVDHQPPEWIPTATIYSESNQANIRYALIEDVAALLYFANWGCIELNPWLSRIEHTDKPDIILFDLDPEGIGFEAVIKAARRIHVHLTDLALPNFIKTSGATGLHIAVPVGAKYSYEETKTFAEIIMRMVQKELPDITSIERMPGKRHGKVYLDFLQNRRGQTMAAPYSLRPRPGAPVSTPLEWKEVKAGLDPAKFTIKSIFARLKKKGDLWRPLLRGKTADLRGALRRLSR